MDFSSEEIEEFKNEALELLDEAEKHLLALEKGGDFTKTYDAVFRVFHSLKGAAGMLSMLELQSHMHQLENHYQQCKPLKTLSKETISYFLKGADAARQLLDGLKVTFEYTLPELKPSFAIKSPASEPTEKIENDAAVNPNSGKIMIVDDEPEIVSILSDLIREAGYQVVGFTSPIEALANLKKEKPDTVLTDYKMPEMSGFDVLKAVNTYDSDLPVVFVSGHVSKDMIIEALSFGVFGVIEKPFTDSQVLGICANASQRYQLVKLLNSTLSFIYFQYADLDEYLKNKGDETLRAVTRTQFKTLIETRRKLEFLRTQTK